MESLFPYQNLCFYNITRYRTIMGFQITNFNHKIIQMHSTVTFSKLYKHFFRQFLKNLVDSFYFYPPLSYSDRANNLQQFGMVSLCVTLSGEAQKGTTLQPTVVYIFWFLRQGIYQSTHSFWHHM